MTKGVQQRRGTTQQHAVFKGEPGEVTVNSDRWTLVVQDGVNNGGYEHVGVAATQRIINKDIVATNLNVTGVSTFQNNVLLGDNINLYLGDSNDLRLYHDGSNSWVRDIGTGSLYLDTNGTNIELLSDGTNKMASFIKGAGVELYHNNSLKFSTVSTGATVNGNLVSQSLNVSGISTLNSANVTNNLQVSGNIGVGTANITSRLHIGAGTTVADTAPIKLDPGQLLTVPERGTLEYDGTLIYATPNSSTRGSVSSVLQYANGSSTVLASSTADQAWLGVGVNLASGIQYEFEGLFNLTTTGTVSHTDRTSFGGTATLTRIGYYIQRSVNTVTATGVNSIWATSAAATVITPAITTAQNAIYRIKGIVEIDAGGTFIPNFSFSAAPGGVSTIVAGAWFKIYPIGLSGVNASVGNWA
jgi:hypothetical protein